MATFHTQSDLVNPVINLHGLRLSSEPQRQRLLGLRVISPRNRLAHAMQPDSVCGMELQQTHLREDRWSSPSANFHAASNIRPLAFVNLRAQLENDMNLGTYAQRNDRKNIEEEKAAGDHLQAQVVEPSMWQAQVNGSCAVLAMSSRLPNAISVSAIEAACQPETMWRKNPPFTSPKVAKPAEILQAKCQPLLHKMKGPIFPAPGGCQPRMSLSIKSCGFQPGVVQCLCLPSWQRMEASHFDVLSELVGLELMSILPSSFQRHVGRKFGARNNDKDKRCILHCNDKIASFVLCTVQTYTCEHPANWAKRAHQTSIMNERLQPNPWNALEGLWAHQIQISSCPPSARWSIPLITSLAPSPWKSCAAPATGRAAGNARGRACQATGGPGWRWGRRPVGGDLEMQGGEHWENRDWWIDHWSYIGIYIYIHISF